MRINLNDRIKVKLTDLGKDIFYHQFDDAIALGAPLKPHMPKTDADGYTSFQLHDFINTYGEHIGIFKPNVIEPIDIICDYDMSYDWISVNDRLPDTKDYVLVTYINTSNEKRYVDMAVYDDDVWEFIDGDYLVASRTAKVIAWQSLPKPYRGE